MADSQVIADSAKPSADSRAAASEHLPRLFGRFELRSLLGHSKTGHMYLAHDPQSDQLLALRIPQPSRTSGPDWKARFLASARNAQRILHPRICPILEVGDCNGLPYVTAPLVEGEPLSRRLTRQGPPSIEESVRWVRSIASALSEIHELGMVHGDLRPSNILIDRHGQPTVLDFGHAVRPDNLRDGRKAYAHLALGVSEYLAPEQAGSQLHSITPAFDVYSLGVLLFELTTGRLPFTASSFGRLIAQIERDPPPKPSTLNPQIDKSLDAILLQSLQKLPAKRYASATQMLKALDAWRPAPSENLYPLPLPLPRPIAKPAARATLTGVPPAALLGSGCIGFVAGALAVFALLQAPKTDNKPLANTPDSSYLSAQDSPSVGKVDQESHSPANNNPPQKPVEPSSPNADPPVDKPIHSQSAATPVVAPSVATTIEMTGWTILADASREETQCWLDEQKENARSVIWLDAIGVNEEPIFSAIVAKDDRQSDWLALLDVTTEEMNNVQVLGQRIDANQYLVTSLAPYHQKEDVFCAALFHPGKKPGCVIGIAPRFAIEKQLKETAGRGLTPKLLRPLGIDGKNPLCALYLEPSNTSDKHYALNADEAKLTEQLRSRQEQGSQPICIAPLQLDGRLTFSYTFHDAPTHANWEHHRDLSASDLKAKAATLSAVGLRPASIVGYTSQGELRYSTIWAKDPSRD